MLNVCSFTEAQSRQELRDRVLKDYPKLNILVNNAGTQRRLGTPHQDALLGPSIILKTSLTCLLTGLPDEPEDWSKRAVELHLNLEVLSGRLQKCILTRLSA